MKTALLICGILLLSGPSAVGADPVTTLGWRGNWTGLYPDARPPLEWSRIARGVAAGTTARAAKPQAGGAERGSPLDSGLIREWLVAGPFAVEDSVKEFDAEQLPGEAALSPGEGEPAGASAWTKLVLEKAPDYERWGTTELDWVDLGERLGQRPNRIAYTHVYLHCQRAGRVALIVDHGNGLKVWANGEVAYSSPQRAMGFGSYVGISRQKQDLVHQKSPRSAFALRAGWNPLLIKIASGNERGSREFKFAARLIDVDPVPYEEKNIRWIARLPERSNASPVIVGDRIFAPAEPDELLCLDKATGKILWRRINGYFEATPVEKRAANPIFDREIRSLAEAVERTADYEEGLALRRKIRDLLVSVNEDEYGMKWDGHLASHFGIVGFTTTPVSDGACVWAFFGHGVVACYDLDGNRIWIRRLRAKEIAYSCTPALAAGKLFVVFDGLHALDAATGEEVWHLPETTTIASLIAARIRGTDVVTMKSGQVFRAADGKLLWSNPHIRTGDTGWAPPVVIGETLYLPWNGITGLIVADFAGAAVEGDAWKPALRVIGLATDNHRPNGEWLDRWTAGSPLILDGTYYGIDQYGVAYAVDLASEKTLYKVDTRFDELHHYNAIGVAASCALGGKHIFVMDNQGSCVVYETGPVFQRVATNKIESLLPRDWPIPAQEILTNGSPVFDGECIYIRGEQHLFSIGPPIGSSTGSAPRRGS